MKELSDEEFKKCQADTLYWYNTYVRKENEPVLTQEQWDEKRAEWQKQREGVFANKFSRTETSDGRTVFFQYPIK